MRALKKRAGSAPKYTRHTLSLSLSLSLSLLLAFLFRREVVRPAREAVRRTLELHGILERLGLVENKTRNSLFTCLVL